MLNWYKNEYQSVSNSSSDLPLDHYRDGEAFTGELPVPLDNGSRNISRRSGILPTLTVLVVVTCTLFNLANFIAPYFKEEVPFTALPRPNQFIGLERVNFSSHPFPSDTRITTFPWTLALIDQSNPRYVFPVDPRRKFTYFGTISPEDRNFLATNEISTIAQFRVRDWGMEWCRLKLSLPAKYQYHSESDSDELEEERERNWVLKGDTSDLEVWELDSTEWINPATLSYDTRPQRKDHIFSWKVQPNSTLYSREFRCPSDAIGTFEIFCVSPGCRVDIWQDKQLPAIGLSLEQRSSI